MIRRIINKLLLNNLDFDAFFSMYERKKNSSLVGNCMVGEGSRFYKEADIVNMQKKKEKIKIGKHNHIRGHLQLFSQGGEILIGDYCYVGENSKIWSASKISIGNRVLIAHNVNIHDNISHPLDAAARHDDYKRILGLEVYDPATFDLRSEEIVIEDDVWIGFNSIIMKGVTLGKGSIIGAGSLITQSVPSNVIVAGNPARIIRSLK